MWNLDRDEDYFRIFDSNKDIAGYFDPDYGDLFPQENAEQLIDQMHKNHDKISGGFVMIPFAKFGIFNEENLSIEQIESQLRNVLSRTTLWKNFLSELKIPIHFIKVSHTDNDMLSITFPLKFSNPTPLDKKSLINEIEPILDLMQKQGLV